jgi:UDP-N-acetylenolpyruvoylglucosamine reductase
LIELCELKNLTSGGAAINQNQPLVIVNQSGQATARDVLSLANKVKEAVFSKTGIELSFEPEMVGF